MSKKVLYIGDFKIKNCTQYGEYEAIRKLKSGSKLTIEYESKDKVICVKSSGDVIGELEVPDQISKVMIPLLLGKHKKDLFECKLHPFDPKEMQFDRLQVTVWAIGEGLSQ